MFTNVCIKRREIIVSVCGLGISIFFLKRMLVAILSIQFVSPSDCMLCSNRSSVMALR